MSKMHKTAILSQKPIEDSQVAADPKLFMVLFFFFFFLAVRQKKQKDHKELCFRS